MATVELTTENLDVLVEKSDMLIIDFWASWCGPCKMFGPTFEAASEKHEGIVFAKCDTEAQQEVAGAFGIRSIPTLVVFRQGIMIFQQAGALPPKVFDEIIEKAQALDMDTVRAELEASKEAPAS